jgi:Flp pilus assembly protein TadB
LLEFLEEAEDTEAALDVYAQLRQVQAEIEQVKGRIQYLEQSAALATVHLDITPDELAQPIQVGGWRPQGTLRNAFQSLIRVLQFLVDALIVIVVLVIPVLVAIALPIAGLFLLVRAIVRRRRARKAE